MSNDLLAYDLLIIDKRTQNYCVDIIRLKNLHLFTYNCSQIVFHLIPEIQN